MKTSFKRTFGLAALVASASPAFAGGTCETCFRREVRPALYATAYAPVVVRPGYTVAERVPARVAAVREHVVVAPERVVARRTPDTVGVVHETVQVAPARRVRELSYDAHGRQVVCDRTVGPQYGVVARHVVVPGRTEHVVVPAQVATVTRHVVTRPAHTVYRDVPPEVHSVPRRVLVRPASEHWVPTHPPRRHHHHW
jgi:histidinol dehydrogenase